MDLVLEMGSMVTHHTMITLLYRSDTMYAKHTHTILIYVSIDLRAQFSVEILVKYIYVVAFSVELEKEKCEMRFEYEISKVSVFLA